MFKIFKKTTGLAVAVAAVAAIMGANAFTASNTVGESFAGSGAGDISGYIVSGITYTNSGGNITAVSFSLDNPASTVSAKLFAEDDENACTEDAVIAGLFSCATNVPALDADSLTVTASQ